MAEPGTHQEYEITSSIGRRMHVITREHEWSAEIVLELRKLNAQLAELIKRLPHGDNGIERRS
jgi:hypothetical protein